MMTTLFRSIFKTIILVGVLHSAAHAQDYQWQVRGALSQIEPTSAVGYIFNNTAKVDIDDTLGFTGTITYFLNPNIAVDVLVGLPPEHDIIVAGTKAAKTKHLPPILSLQYHFNPEGKISPYVGAGLNYTYFFSEKLDGGGDLHLSSSFGLAAQIGADIRLSPQWSVGADVRYADISTDVKINGVEVGKVDVNPTIYSLNLGYRF